jgi:hypothetical protein
MVITVGLKANNECAVRPGDTPQEGKTSMSKPNVADPLTLGQGWSSPDSNSVWLAGCNSKEISNKISHKKISRLGLQS